MSYLTDPCDRCGSKKILTKSHIEIIETFSGKQKIEVQVIKCSNKECQALQEKNNEISQRESEDRKKKKEAQDALKSTARKNNIQLSRKKKDIN